MIRHVALLLFLAISAAPINVQAQHVESIEVVSYGIFGVGDQKSISDSRISTGERVNYDGSKIVKRTSTIALHQSEDKIVFGAQFALKGSPAGYAPRLRVVWLYPQPGLKNPQTGKVAFRDEYEIADWQVGRGQNLYWTLTAAWARVPGRWTLQVWHGGRLLAEQSFNLVKV